MRSARAPLLQRFASSAAEAECQTEARWAEARCGWLESRPCTLEADRKGGENRTSRAKVEVLFTSTSHFQSPSKRDLDHVAGVDGKTRGTVPWRLADEAASGSPMTKTTRRKAAATTAPASVLVLGTRGLKARHRHLMQDILRLLPHGRPGAKLDAQESGLRGVVSACEEANCSSALLLDARDPHRLYLWAAGTPDGPSAMLRVQNVHTVAELNLAVRRCANVRNLLAFDSSFEVSAERRVLRALLTRIFAVPRGAVRRSVVSSSASSEGLSAIEEAAAGELEGEGEGEGEGEEEDETGAPSGGGGGGEDDDDEEEADDAADASAAAGGEAHRSGRGGSGERGGGGGVERVKHSLSFSWVDDRIWIRVFRIGRGPTGALDAEEIGPRMTLEPVRIIASGFAGAILHSNERRHRGDDSDEEGR